MGSGSSSSGGSRPQSASVATVPAYYPGFQRSGHKHPTQGTVVYASERPRTASAYNPYSAVQADPVTPGSGVRASKSKKLKRKGSKRAVYMQGSNMAAQGAAAPGEYPREYPQTKGYPQAQEFPPASYGAQIAYVPMFQGYPNGGASYTDPDSSDYSPKYDTTGTACGVRAHYDASGALTQPPAMRPALTPRTVPIPAESRQYTQSQFGYTQPAPVAAPRAHTTLDRTTGLNQSEAPPLPPPRATTRRAGDGVYGELAAGYPATQPGVAMATMTSHSQQVSSLPYPASPAQGGIPEPHPPSGDPAYPPPEGKHYEGALYALHPGVATTTEAEVVAGEEGEVSEERDRVYMMVLSAEEFLGRMHETDTRMYTLSLAAERELHEPTIRKCLGLRGHVQDELLRIEAMLAVTDPDLKALGAFQRTHPAIVTELRMLNERKKQLAARGAQVDLPDTRGRGRAAGVAAGTQADPAQSTGTSQTEGPTSGASVTKSTESATQSQDADELPQTEEELENLHKKEEDEMAAIYAAQITQRKETLTQDDFVKVIGDHALAMQALRQRQGLERSRWQENAKAAMVEQRRKSKRFKKQSVEKEASDLGENSAVLEDLTSQRERERTTHDLLTSQRQVDLLTSSHGPARDPGVLERERTAQELLTKQRQADLLDRKQKYEVTDEPEDQVTEETEAVQNGRKQDSEGSEGEAEVERNTADAMWTKLNQEQGATSGQLQSMMRTIAEDEKLKVVMRRHTLDKETEPAETGSQTEVQPASQTELELLRDRDRSFVRRALSRQNASDAPAELAAMFVQHLTDTAHLQPFTQNGGSLSPRTQEEVRKLADTLGKQVARRRGQAGSDVSEADLAELLAEYRRRQLVLLRRRTVQRRNHADRAREKMMARKNKKAEKPPADTAPQKPGSDEAFWQKLQQRQESGQLSKDEFSQLLQSYMRDQRGQARRQLQLSEDPSLHAEKASALLQQHQQELERAHDLRRAEKDKMDARLRRRLSEKRKQRRKVAQDGGEGEDEEAGEAVEELSRLPSGEYGESDGETF